MKPIKLLCVVSRTKPQIELNNFVTPKDKGGIILAKGEKIIETITIPYSDYQSLLETTLEKYTEFLCKKGYTDDDVWSEKPTAISRFFKG
jgi:hypothetical protein